jgi:hypothetical protein
MAGNWDTYDAEQMLAQRKFAEESGPCPACDGEAYVEAIDISCFGGFNNFLPGKTYCAAECWTEDPERYIESVKQIRRDPPL